MKEIYFSDRRDYAHYMAHMRLALEQSIPPELMLAGSGVNKIKMDISQKMRYSEIYLGYCCHSLWRGYPKRITMADKFTRI
jgi:hypothetical protein